MRLKNFLYSKERFWKLRRLFENSVSFNIFKNAHRSKSFIREEKISFSIFRSLFKSLILYVLYGALFVGLFELLSSVVPFKIRVSLDYSSAKDLIATIVTVIGIFLGLYFTAVSAVAGDLFMRATNDLQELFLRERKGRQYIQTLGLTTIIGIYYLGLGALGHKFSIFGLFAMILLAAYSAIRFVALGFRAFYFIHPIEAIATITGDAAYAIDNAAITGFGWKKPFLQNHYRKQADNALGTMRSLINFCIEAIKVSEEQLVAIARYVGGILTYYLERKKRIPTESYWHRTKYKFQNWLFADSTELTLALNTGTSLSPKSVKDVTWFEGECIDVILKVVDYFINKKEWESAHACLEVLISISEKVGDDFYVDLGKLMLLKLSPSFKRAFDAIGEPKDIQSQKALLAFIDSFGRLGIGLLIGLLRHLDKRTCANLSWEIKAIDWISKAGVYKSELPGNLLIKLETTSEQCRTEKAIEGQLLSPEWYLVTITAQQYLFELKKYFDFIKSLHKDLFKTNIEDLIAKNKFIAASGLVQRWLEFLNKLSVCGSRFQKFTEGCTSLRGVVDLPWIEVDFVEERKLIESWDKEASDKLVFLIPVLSQLPSPDLDNIPDYFGQAHTFGLEACYQACSDNDTERFKELFPRVLLGALSAYDSARKQTQGWTQDSQIIYSSEPLEDLLSLSGFAKLYSELYQNLALWRTCENAWNGYLSSVNAKNIISLMAATASYRDSRYVIMPKAIIRSNWDINFRRKLHEMNLVTDPFEDYLSDRDGGINHPSPIIRVVGRYADLLPASARNIFFATYMSTLEAAQGVDFPDRRDIGEQIQREADRAQNQENHDEQI